MFGKEVLIYEVIKLFDAGFYSKLKSTDYYFLHDEFLF